MHNKKHPSAYGNALETAADWIDRFESLTPDERAAFDAWLHADGIHRTAYAAMRHTMLDAALLDACEDLAEAHPSWRKRLGGFARAIRQHLASLPAAWAMGGTVAAALAAMLLTMLPRGSAPSPWQDYATGLRQRAEYRLSDATELALDADTRLSVQYAPGARTIALQHGEATFHVAKDPKRPFRVKTALLTATALGTVFDVDLIGNAVAVRVFEGSVRVSDRDGHSRVVTGGHWFLGDTSGGHQSGAFSPSTYRDWQSDWLEADKMPLPYVVTKLNRYSAKKVILADAALAGVTVSGRFRLSRTDDTLAMISALLDIDLQKKSDRIVLVGRSR